MTELSHEAENDHNNVIFNADIWRKKRPISRENERFYNEIIG